jgi:hypothetical protein
MMRNWAHEKMEKKNIHIGKIRQDGPTLGEEAAGVVGGPCVRLLLIQFRFHKGTVKLYYNNLTHLQMLQTGYKNQIDKNGPNVKNR